jgi:hypothetical protein
MSLGEVFDSSIAEYKKNFKPIVSFIILWLGIPLLLFSIISAVWVLNDPELFSFLVVSSLHTQEENTAFLQSNLVFYLIGAVFAIVTMILMTFVQAGMTNTSVTSKQYSNEILRKSARSSFWKYVGVVLLMFLYLFLISLPFLIILGVTIQTGLVKSVLGTVLSFLAVIVGIVIVAYFGNSWLLAPYILFAEKKRISESLKESRKIVKGRWWRTFGYFLILMLVVGLCSLVLTLPSTIVSILGKGTMAGGGSGAQILFVLISLLSFLQNIIYYLVWIPFSVFYLKNYYLSLKKENR